MVKYGIVRVKISNRVSLVLCAMLILLAVKHSDAQQVRRPRVSQSDSAAALAMFRNASGGTGYYYETTISISNSRMGTVNTKARTYFTTTGEGRNETDIGALMGGTSRILVGLTRAAHPQYSMMLDDKSRTYMLNIIDTSILNGRNERYAVTKLGAETIAGFPCIHSRLFRTTAGANSTSNTMEVWTSKSVPGYANFKKMTASGNITPAMIQALDKAGAGGYFVKVSITRPDYSMTSTLSAAETRSLPAALFRIPEGYRQDRANLMFGR